MQRRGFLTALGGLLGASALAPLAKLMPPGPAPFVDNSDEIIELLRGHQEKMMREFYRNYEQYLWGAG